MKRSQMLSLIEDCLYCSNFEDKLIDQANDILTVIEKAGMLPPTRTGITTIKEDGDSIFIELWSWEEE